MNDNELLQLAIAQGILDISTIRQNVEMNERKRILEQHKYKIWQGANGKWYTELPATVERPRRLIKKTKYEDLEESIIKFYTEDAKVQTVKATFIEWVNQKLAWGEIKKGTYDRYTTAFERYFKNTDFPGANVEWITADYLENLIKTIIVNQKLTSKAYNNMRTLVIGTFKWAKKKGYTKLSISEFFGDLALSKKIFTKPEQKPQVFMEDEVVLLIQYLKDNPTIGNLGLLLTFWTGIREGELSAIKAADLINNRVRIRRQEIKYKDPVTKKMVHEIVDYPKTEAGYRDIPLKPEALETYKTIIEMSAGNEYLMMDGDRKIWTNSFNDYLYKACDEVGIPRRSMHKIRKTYGTTLIDAGVDDSITTYVMGHEDIATTREYYYFCNKKDSSRDKQILEAITF